MLSSRYGRVRWFLVLDKNMRMISRSPPAGKGVVGSGGEGGVFLQPLRALETNSARIAGWNFNGSLFFLSAYVFCPSFLFFFSFFCLFCCRFKETQWHRPGPVAAQTVPAVHASRVTPPEIAEHRRMASAGRSQAAPPPPPATARSVSSAREEEEESRWAGASEDLPPGEWGRRRRGGCWGGELVVLTSWRHYSCGAVVRICRVAQSRFAAEFVQCVVTMAFRDRPAWAHVSRSFQLVTGGTTRPFVFLDLCSTPERLQMRSGRSQTAVGQSCS